MKKKWLKQYPDTIPHTIDMGKYESLLDIIEESFDRFGDKTAYSNMGQSLTFSDVAEQSETIAAYFQSLPHLKQGDRVAIMMPNLLQYPIVLFGILRAGLTVVNLNPLYTAHELEHILSDSKASALVVLENFAHVFEEIKDRVSVKYVFTSRIGDALRFPKRLLVNWVVHSVKKMVPDFNLPDATPIREILNQTPSSYSRPTLSQKDLAFLQYTGGTTGISKGAMLSHGNIIANLLQIKSWVAPFIAVGEEKVLTPLPLYHIFSLTANLLTFCHLGGHLILITNPRDIPLFIKTISSTPFTVMTGVNTLFNSLANHRQFKDIDFSQLKFSIGGGMAVQKDVATRWQTITQSPLIEGYGLTESSPVACVNLISSTAYSGAIGFPLPSTELSIRHENGTRCQTNEEGEIWIKGPQVMQGYWERKKETQATLTPDGWLKTGDIGRMDERGQFYLVDRKKDMILGSGFNVYPNEVENAAMLHPDVKEAAAIGVPNKHSGEVVKLYCVRHTNTLTESELRQHCKKYLTHYKLPKVVEFKDHLPKTNIGKILRRALR